MTILTQEQLEQQSALLLRNSEYRGIYRQYRREFVGSTNYDPVRNEVLQFIEEFNAIQYPTTTHDDAVAVLDEYDYTYGRDHKFNLLPEHIRTISDPDGFLKEFFRGFADFEDYFDQLLKQLSALPNPFETPEEFLGVLGGNIGIDVPYALDETVKRLKIARAIDWYKIKGTHDSFDFLLKSLGFSATVTELWTDYNLTKFDETPDVYPILADGSPNPAYDPFDYNDGLIKYKSSFFDLQAAEIGETISFESLPIILDAIEEVRPITRTLRTLTYVKNLSDEFPEVTDDHEGEIIFMTEDRNNWTDNMYPSCLLFGCNLTGYTYQGGIDYATTDVLYDDPTGDPGCTEFYDHGIYPYYDGVAIANYSGLSSPGGTEFLYNGDTLDGTLFYEACHEPDELEVLIQSDFEDPFLGDSLVYYDNKLGTNFGNPLGLTYSNQDKILDTLEIDMGPVEIEDTLPTDDELEGGVNVFEEGDELTHQVLFNGVYNFDNAAGLLYEKDNIFFPDELTIIIEPIPEIEIDLEDTVTMSDDDGESDGVLEFADAFSNGVFFNGAYAFDNAAGLLYENNNHEYPDELTIIIEPTGPPPLWDGGDNWDSGIQWVN